MNSANLIPALFWAGVSSLLKKETRVAKKDVQTLEGVTSTEVVEKPLQTAQLTADRADEILGRVARLRQDLNGLTLELNHDDPLVIPEVGEVNSLVLQAAAACNRAFFSAAASHALTRRLKGG